MSTRVGEEGLYALDDDGGEAAQRGIDHDRVGLRMRWARQISRRADRKLMHSFLWRLRVSVLGEGVDKSMPGPSACMRRRKAMASHPPTTLEEQSTPPRPLGPPHRHEPRL